MSSSSSLAALKKLKVVDLRDQLTAVGLSTEGVKADLVQRLFEALHPPEEVEREAATVSAAALEEGEEIDRDIPVAPLKPKTLVNVAPAPDAADEPPQSQHELAEQRKKRCQRFGLPIPDSKVVIEKTTLDGGLSNKRKRDKKGESPPAKLNIDDPDVQRRLKRFGIPTAETASSTIILQAYNAAEEAKKKAERSNRFGAATSPNSTPASKADFDVAVASRKARFAAV